MCLKERDDNISASQVALLVKEEEIAKREQELMKKTDEAANAESQLRFKSGSWMKQTKLWKSKHLSSSNFRELKRDLLLEKQLVAELQTTLDKERSALKQAVSELSALREEIDSKTAAFEQSQTLLKAKESELVEARLKIQHLKPELVSLQLILEQKDLKLSDAKEMLEELSHQIAELKGILSSREEELIGAVSKLKEKGQQVLTMQHELTNAQLKFSEAEAVVGKIVDLTNEVVLLFNDQGYYALIPTDKENHGLSSPLLDRLPDSSKWQVKQNSGANPLQNDRHNSVQTLCKSSPKHNTSLRRKSH